MQTDYEVIIIGGSYSGLSAAMALGRSQRKVLVIDSGKPCNRHTPHSHNFITNDGKTPADIAQRAKAEVLTYPTVSFLNDTVTDAQKRNDTFSVQTKGGKTVTAFKLLFTTGVADDLPAIDNFEDCWGISVVHCPYCHGYEARNKKTGIVGNGEAAHHYAALLLQLTNDITIYTNGPAEFNDDQLKQFAKHNITIIEDRIIKVKHTKGQAEALISASGKAFPLGVVYYRPTPKQHCTLPEKLGCELDEMGYLKADFLQKTTVEGIYAAGDNTTPMRSVATAVATGNKAGAAINGILAIETF
ncbi:NAD(P)/FAD-dependent oxidoreductase [Flavobacterium alkalisoli]|uniref:NAD(P)/FAD-dependent oxidoreductase n=1 Tax=Flavobacterium alkalisoli TaxID=2602769 RepID=A0A5B9FVH7_9FLAO|nr:NAD(P)/FAD-dependent oxidoreductase [Flavobacterium alkalisoli]QEE50171.1 NAD(P)/FAD-dependent oxidoreductase [Flavobacterium alkalisoli]